MSQTGLPFQSASQQNNSRRLKSINAPYCNASAFFTNTSESIASFMVEKLISFTMTHIFQNKIMNDIPSFCFKDLQHTLDPFIQMSFIPYDHDDFDNPLKEFNESVLKEDLTKRFFDNNIEQIEMVDDAIDHSHHSEANTVRIKNLCFYDNQYEGVNCWDIPIQPKTVSIDRDASSVIPFEKVEPDEHKEMSEEANQSSMSNKKVVRNHPPKPRKRWNDLNLSPPKKKKGVMPVEIVAHDLPKDVIENAIQLDELAQLRIDREREKVRKENENRIRQRMQMENLAKQNESAQKQKEFEYKNITVDSDGAVLRMKEVQPETFPVEFTGATSVTKDVQHIHAEPFKLPILPPPNRIDKIKAAQLAANINNNPNPPSSTKVIRNKETSNISTAQALNKIVPVLQFVPEKKNDLREEKLYREKYGLQPSGSNFEAMKLEVGVCLQEEARYKTGGKDFYKKYKKYSVENFQSTLTKTSNLNDNISHVEKKADKKRKEQDDKNKMPDHEVLYENINTEPSSTVKFLNVKTKNLRGALNRLDLITEEQEKQKIKGDFNRTRPGDMYKRPKAMLMTEESHGNYNEEYANEGGGYDNTYNCTQTNFNEMNQFAKTILSNQAWGTAQLKYKEKSTIQKMPVKPQLADLRKELPNVIVNTKMPRSRVFAYVKDKDKAKDMMANTTSQGFFKVAKNKTKKYKPELTHTDGYYHNEEMKGDKQFNKTAGDNLFKD